MISTNRNLLVLFKPGLPDEGAVKREMYWLKRILLHTESQEQFCQAHELVDRNRITSNRKKIIKETRYKKMKPFRFLINKN